MAKKRHHDGSHHGHHASKKSLEHHDYYAGHENRMKMEHEDGGMIKEDHNAQANMPQNIIMRHYGDSYAYLPEDLDDSIRGIDGQIREDDGKRREHFRPKKV